MEDDNTVLVLYGDVLQEAFLSDVILGRGERHLHIDPPAEKWIVQVVGQSDHPIPVLGRIPIKDRIEIAEERQRLPVELQPRLLPRTIITHPAEEFIQKDDRFDDRTLAGAVATGEYLPWQYRRR